MDCGLSALIVLAYRHLFHAGGFADVFKHALLVQLAIALARKEKPFLYLDTHAGIGRYDLQHPWAQKNAEYRDGIARVFSRTDSPHAVRPYLNAVREENPDGQLRFYPGSPALVQRLLRENDRMALAELNREDCARLQQEFAGERRAQVRNMDGYQALKAFLPPKERRGLILIDPPYEAKTEADRALRLLAQGLRRFAGGVYVVWYPLKAGDVAQTVAAGAAGMGVAATLRVELRVREAVAAGGLAGSGLLILNAPWRLDEELRRIVPALAQRLGLGDWGQGSVDWLVPPK